MRIITLAIAFIIGISAEAQIIRAEPFYTAPEEAAVAANLLLDSFPGAAVAYSLRKLDKDYTGSAIRVRRSSDNTEQDIGFVNNYLDTAAMKTFVGANDGFVVTWYNQADSSGVFGVRNATQTTAANQPQIINSGQINYDANEVSLKFDGTNDNFVINNSKATFNNFHNGNYGSLFAVAKFGITSDPNTAYVLVHNNGASFGQTGFTYYYDDRSSISRNNASAAAISRSVANQPTASTVDQDKITPNADALITALYNSGSATADDRIKLAVNSSALYGSNTFTNTAAATNATNDLQIGSISSALFLSGSIKEISLYNSDQSSNRTGIRDNINSFYSIY